MTHDTGLELDSGGREFNRGALATNTIHSVNPLPKKRDSQFGVLFICKMEYESSGKGGFQSRAEKITSIFLQIHNNNYNNMNGDF